MSIKQIKGMGLTFVLATIFFINRLVVGFANHKDQEKGGDVSPAPLAVNCPSRCSCERTSGKLTVDCSYRKLTSLPDFSVLQHENLPIDVNLDGNNFPHIIGTSLWYIGARLRSLYITNNERVFNIGERAFSQPHYKIKILRLSPVQNDLEYNLKTILSSNTLEKVYVETRSSNPIPLEAPLTDGVNDLQLNVLHLHDCGVSKLGHMAVAGLTLKELGLSKNLLTSFPVVLWYMMAETLEVLYLDQNRITALKKNQFPRRCKLRKLFLQSNIISVIQQDTIDNCQKLEVINLAGNVRLNTLDSSLFVHLDNLKLDLRSTGITRFDFVTSFQTKLLSAFNENSVCKCKEAFPYLLKFGSKLKAFCLHPESKEKESIHEVCAAALSRIEEIEDGDEIVQDLKKHPVYSYDDTVDESSLVWAEGGLIKFFGDMFDLKEAKSNPARTRRRMKTEDEKFLDTEDNINDIFSVPDDFDDVYEEIGESKVDEGKASATSSSDSGNAFPFSEGVSIPDISINKSNTTSKDLVVGAKQNSNDIERKDNSLDILVDETTDDVDVQTDDLREHNYSSLKFGDDMKTELKNKGIKAQYAENNEEPNRSPESRLNKTISEKQPKNDESKYGYRKTASTENPSDYYDSTVSSNYKSMTASDMNIVDHFDETKDPHYGAYNHEWNNQREPSFSHENKQDKNSAFSKEAEFTTCLQSCELSCLKTVHFSHTKYSQSDSKETRRFNQNLNDLRSSFKENEGVDRTQSETLLKHTSDPKYAGSTTAEHELVMKKNNTRHNKGTLLLSRSASDLPLFACVLLLAITYMTHDKLSRMSGYKHFDYICIAGVFFDKLMIISQKIFSAKKFSLLVVFQDLNSLVLRKIEDN